MSATSSSRDVRSSSHVSVTSPMRLALAASRPSWPSRAAARRPTHRSQRMPETWIVSLVMTVMLAPGAQPPARARAGAPPPVAGQERAPRARFAAISSASAATSAESGGRRAASARRSRVELAVVGLRLVVGNGGDERLDDRGEAGRAANVGLLVHHAHLERPVLRPRPRVPVAPRVVSCRRLLPRGPVGKRAAACRRSA